jgi:hypothetical protein
MVICNFTENRQNKESRLPANAQLEFSFLKVVVAQRRAIHREWEGFHCFPKDSQHTI